jgi:hypothetical protein
MPRNEYYYYNGRPNSKTGFVSTPSNWTQTGGLIESMTSSRYVQARVNHVAGVYAKAGEPLTPLEIAYCADPTVRDHYKDDSVSLATQTYNDNILDQLERENTTIQMHLDVAASRLKSLQNEMTAKTEASKQREKIETQRAQNDANRQRLDELNKGIAELEAAIGRL